MVEQDHQELTKEETELYDRQIRLWGLENQKKWANQQKLSKKIIKISLDCEIPKSSSLV